MRCLQVVMQANRYPDPILDESLPDPVYDETDFGYTGKVPYGFSEFAEKVNGRAAMMGFSVLYVQEAVSGIDAGERGWGTNWGKAKLVSYRIGVGRWRALEAEARRNLA